MHTILVAATLAASTAGAQTPGHHHRSGCCLPGFAPAVHNGRLVTPPVEDQSRVYTPGASSVRARLWVSDDVKDVASRRAWRQNPGRVAYGAADAGHERVHVRVYNQKVSVSAWQQIEGEGLANFEAARQQWLAERGLTGGVRTFVHPSRLRDGDAPRAAAPSVPAPSATIRLRKERTGGGTLKEVRAGTPGTIRVVRADEPVAVSFPDTVSREVVERAAARGWITERPAPKTRVARAGE